MNYAAVFHLVKPFSYQKAILLSLGFLLLLDLSGLDVIIAKLSYHNDFALRHNFWFKTIGHDLAQKLAWLIYFALLFSCIFAPSIFKDLSKLRRTQLALMPLFSILLITLIKNNSGTSCPWDLAVFSGSEPYFAHWLNLLGISSAKGNCFPAGHATSGFAFLGGFFIWRQSKPKLAQIWFWSAFSVGLFLGLIQQIRGAHFLSHTLWSAWFCFVAAKLAFDFIAYFASFSRRKFKADLTAWFKFELKSWQLILLFSLYLTLSGNLPLLRKLHEYDLFNLPLVLGLNGIIFCVLNFILGLLALPYVLKTVLVLLLAVAASASYFTSNYGILLDPSMLQNVLQTDQKEAFDLLSFKLIIYWSIFAFMSILWLLLSKIKFAPFKRSLWFNPIFAFTNLIIALGIIWLIFQPLAASMRTHKDLRYLLNPLASLYSTGAVIVRSTSKINKTLQPIGLDAVLMPSVKPKLILLVIGETARASNFSLNGYERQTNPHLSQIKDLVSFSNVISCGTNTADSLPCMFAHLERAKHIKEQNNYENLLDVLSRAGLAVLWLDNQSGCKGVCQRIANFAFNNGGFDLQMLGDLETQIAALDAAKVKNGVVIVMHQMGSHGPAYYLRSPIEHKKFMPECTSNYLAACSKESLFNVYDNSLIYLDYFLAQSINFLQQQDKFDGGLLYVSDHGESLGERNIYLHGMPYAIAPKWQKHVPMITWFSSSFIQNNRIDNKCLAAKKDAAISHDYLFHSVLALAGVKTHLYQAQLDIFANCRN